MTDADKELRQILLRFHIDPDINPAWLTIGELLSDLMHKQYEQGYQDAILDKEET